MPSLVHSVVHLMTHTPQGSTHYPRFTGNATIIVESIEFDFSDSMGTIPEEEQKFITENTLGLWLMLKILNG